MPAQAASCPWARLDTLLCVVVAVVAAIPYAVLAWRLGRGVYAQYFNLGFDFDPPLMVGALALHPPNLVNAKHPLVVLLRPLAWPFLWAGFTARESAGLVMAGFGAGTVVLCFAFLRCARIERPIALALVVLYAVSGTQLFAAMIPETYGIALFSIAATWTVALLRLRGPRRLLVLRYAVAALTFGTTVTNVVQSVLAELLVGWRHAGPWRAIRCAIRFGLVLAAVVAALCVAVWSGPLLAALHDPVHAVKELWWLQTHGAKTGPAQVALTFFGYSFVSPGYTWLRLDDGILMRDFRTYAFAAPGGLAMPAWLGFCAVGVVAGLRHPRYRVIAAGLAAALVFNLLFHLRFQERGSLYLYAAHLHFLVFALAAGLAPWLSARRWGGRAYMAVVLGLAILLAMVNVPIVRAFANGFDDAGPFCAPPCVLLPHAGD